MICADSCFIIDLLRGNSEAVKKAQELEVPVTTSINSFEVLNGILSKPHVSKNELFYCQDFFKNIKTLEFDYRASMIASEIDNTLIKEGKKIDVFDSLIAGTMLAHGVNMILTRNKHFERIKGIKTVSY